MSNVDSKLFNLILIRYNEIWLKSKKVKSRLIKTLTKNIVFSLNKNQITFHKYQFSKDFTRILFFLKNEDIERAVEVLKNIFGIHSVSPGFRTSSQLENIANKALELGEEILEPNDSFAIRARRSGKHDFSSQDVANQVGKAFLDRLTELNLQVNLSSPKKKVFIEVREDFTYLFTKNINSNWGGLPIEENKHILSINIGRTTDILSTFLLMRRGCKIHGVIFDLLESTDINRLSLSIGKVLSKYYNSKSLIFHIIDFHAILKEIFSDIVEKEYYCSLCNIIRFKFISTLLSESEHLKKYSIRGITSGANLANIGCCPNSIDLDLISTSTKYFSPPIFTPCIGLNSEDIFEKLKKISPEIEERSYCPFCPENQKYTYKSIKNLIKSINLEEIIKKSLKEIKTINVFL